MEMLVEFIKYAWIPLLGVIWRDLKLDQKKQDEEIEKLKNKISHQMTKEDVIEVVTNATNLLSMQMKLELEKINNGVHQIKNQNSGKDLTLIEVNSTLKELHDFLRKNEKN